MAANLQYVVAQDPRKGRSRPDLWKEGASDPAIAELRLQGFTNKDIALHTGLRSRSTVESRLRKMGFPKRQCRFEHGQPVTGRAILDLCDDFGLTKRDVVKILKSEQNTIHRYCSDSMARQLPTWLSESIYRQSIGSKTNGSLGLEVADRLISLQKKWLLTFCIRYGRHRERVREFLDSEIRELPDLRARLKDSLNALRTSLPVPENDQPQAYILGWICKQARSEVASTNGNSKRAHAYQTLMFFWPALSALIVQKPDLRTGTWSPGELVDALLAKDYSATPYRIRCAAKGGLTPLDPRTLGQRILEALGQNRNAVAAENIALKRKRGRGREAEKDKTYFKVGTAVETKIPNDLKQDRHSIVAARRLISENTRLQFDVVAQYHKRFRQFCAKTGTEIPS